MSVDRPPRPPEPLPPHPGPLPPNAQTSDPRDDALEALLRSEPLIPLPLGLVTRVLEAVGAEPTRVGEAAGTPRVRRPARVAAVAAAAVLALGLGALALWASTSSHSGDALDVLASPSADRAPFGSPFGTIRSFAAWTGATRETASDSVRSLAELPDRVPGDPVTLGAGAVLLLGAAVAGATRGGRARSSTPREDR